MPTDVKPQVTATVVACGASRSARGAHICSRVRTLRRLPRARRRAYRRSLRDHFDRLAEMQQWFETSRAFRPELPEDERGLTYKRALALVAPIVARHAEALAGDAELVALLESLAVAGRAPQEPPSITRRVLDGIPEGRPPPALVLIRSLTVAPLAP